MVTILVILHLLVCFTLMVVILMQAGKGADIGASFGAGSSQTLFGSRGSASFLTKVTAVAGAMFMITSLALAILSTGGISSSIVKEDTSKAAPAMPGGMPGGMPAGMPGGPAGGAAQPQTGMPGATATPAQPVTTQQTGAINITPAKTVPAAPKGGK